MDTEVREEFFNAMLQFKKVGATFPASCEIQMAELTVMYKIIGGCKMMPTVCVSEIHENLCISKPAVSQILNSLEKKGYIVRKIDSSDRRKISVEATDSGTYMVEESLKEYDRVLEKLLVRFGAENMRELLGHLSKLIEIMDELRYEQIERNQRLQSAK